MGRLATENQRQRSLWLARMADQCGDSLTDAEILEAIIFPEGDAIGSQAFCENLLKEYGTLAAVVHAEKRELTASGLTTEHIARLSLIHLTLCRTLRATVTQQPVIAGCSALMDYLTAKIAHHQFEQTHVLFVDQRFILIADECLWRGSFNHTPVYPREIVKRALELNALGVILAHNHPVNDATPSPADIEVTHKVAKALKSVNLSLLDHLIMTSDGCYSFRTMGHFDNDDEGAV